AHQLARRVAGEDQHGVPRRLTLFQQRLPPFGARGASPYARAVSYFFIVNKIKHENHQEQSS
ncbi:hypothetical protein, partial [Cronobacter sakazakii]|uniref:hypothetical protein n=1 Tax=Cronobacter sakazakii TaxID=28141 RepID=UPI001054A25B